MVALVLQEVLVGRVGQELQEPLAAQDEQEQQEVVELLVALDLKEI